MASTSSSAAAAAADVAARAEDSGAAGGQGGIDRDVNSILANLNQEQLASIVAAARASEGGHGGDEAFSSSGADASSILAALPPGLGQAASALTSLTSSVKKDDGEANGAGESLTEGAEAIQQDEEQKDDIEATTGEGAEGGQSDETAAQGGTDQAEQYGEDAEEGQGASGEAPQGEADDQERADQGAEDGDESKLDDSVQPGEESTDDYRNENATQAAIAAMESLAAQSSMNLYGQQGVGRSNSQSKRRDAGPEAERMRKDQHKEVERKRREQISNGITELQAIVPGCDTKGINKTAIINAAVRYIQELKNNEASNIEKWTLEKLLMDQAMNDLQHQLEHVRKENTQFRQELGLPEPEEEPLPEHYGREHEGTVGEAGVEDAQEQAVGEHAPMEEEANQHADDANLDPDLGKEGVVATEGAGETEAAEGADEQTSAVKESNAVANGVTAATEDEAPATSEHHDDKTAIRTRDAAELAEDETAPGRAKRTRHA